MELGKQKIVEMNETQTRLIFRSYRNTARVYRNGIADKVAEVEAAATRQEPSFDRAELADIKLALQQVSRDVAVSDERMSDLGRRVDPHAAGAVGAR